jgi:hypothetical protein
MIKTGELVTGRGSGRFKEREIAQMSSLEINLANITD